MAVQAIGQRLQVGVRSILNKSWAGKGRLSRSSIMGKP